MFSTWKTASEILDHISSAAGQRTQRCYLSSTKTLGANLLSNTFASFFHPQANPPTLPLTSDVSDCSVDVLPSFNLPLRYKQARVHIRREKRDSRCTTPGSSCKKDIAKRANGARRQDLLQREASCALGAMNERHKEHLVQPSESAHAQGASRSCDLHDQASAVLHEGIILKRRSVVRQRSDR